MKLEWDWSEVEWVGMDVQKYAETKQNEELPVSQSTDGRIYHWGCERWRTMGWHCRARMSSCPSACSEPVQWWACWMQHRWWLWRRLLPRSWSCARPGTRTRNPESRCSVSGGTLALTCSRSWRISLDPRQFQHGPLFDARKRFIHHRYIRPFVTAKGEAVRHTTIKMDKQEITNISNAQMDGSFINKTVNRQISEQYFGGKNDCDMTGTTKKWIKWVAASSMFHPHYEDDITHATM